MTARTLRLHEPTAERRSYAAQAPAQAERLRQRLLRCEEGEHALTLAQWAIALRQSEVNGRPPQQVGRLTEHGLYDSYFDPPPPSSPTLAFGPDAYRAVLTDRDSQGVALRHPDDVCRRGDVLEGEGIALHGEAFLRRGGAYCELDDDPEPDPALTLEQLHQHVLDCLRPFEDPAHPACNRQRLLNTFRLRDALERWSRRR